MEDFTEHIENIIKYSPLGDDILVTGNTIIKKGNDIVDTEEKTAINYIQEVVEVGPRVTEIKVGDLVDINFNNMKEIADHGVFLNGDKEVLFLLIPSRYVRGKIELGEKIIKTVDNINLENE